MCSPIQEETQGSIENGKTLPTFRCEIQSVDHDRWLGQGCRGATFLSFLSVFARPPSLAVMNHTLLADPSYITLGSDVAM